jgi:hypothetical protein
MPTPMLGDARRRAARFLRDRATIARPPAAGSGGATLVPVATNVPCHVRTLQQDDLAALPGGFEAVQGRAIEFAPAQDVRQEDVVTVGTTPYRVRGTTAGETDAVLLTAYVRAGR